MNALSEIGLAARADLLPGIDVCDLQQVRQAASTQKDKRHCYLILLTAGRGFHYINDKSVYCRPATLLLLNSYQSWRLTELSQWQGLAVRFEEADLVSRDNSAASTQLKVAMRQMDVLYDVSARLVADVQALQQECENPCDSLSQAMRKNMLHNLLFRAVLRENHNVVCASSDRAMALFTRFSDLVSEQCCHSHSVSDYTAQLRVSRERLNRVVQIYQGVPAKRYIERQIIAGLKRSLVHSASPIASIAYEAGFKEPTNMTKFFRKHTGFSPSEYRKSMKQPACIRLRG